MTQSPVAPRSRRGRRAHEERILTPLEQIRVPPAGVQGAWAYYLRPDGATILDALILYPNGGVPDIPENPRLAARYGVNAAYYRERQRAKGFEYLGQTLTEGGMKKVVEVLKENAEDEILFVEDEIARCQHDIETADDPKWRDNQRKRMGQFKRRLHYLKEELDPDRMEEELREIARAQQLANVDPNVLRVMRAMIGEVNEKMAAAIAKFSGGKDSGAIDPDTGEATRKGRGGRRSNRPTDEGALEAEEVFVNHDPA